MFFKRKLDAWALLAGWFGYWTVLGASTLLTPLRTLWRVTRPPSTGNNASMSFGSDGVGGTISAQGSEVWSGHVSLLGLFLWVAGPPLLMWAVWLFARTRRDSIDHRTASEELGGDGSDLAALRSPDALPMSAAPRVAVTPHSTTDAE